MPSKNKSSEVLVMEIVKENPRMEPFLVNLVGYTKRLQKLFKERDAIERYIDREPVKAQIRALPSEYLGEYSGEDRALMMEGMKLVNEKLRS